MSSHATREITIAATPAPIPIYIAMPASRFSGNFEVCLAVSRKTAHVIKIAAPDSKGKAAPPAVIPRSAEMVAKARSAPLASSPMTKVAMPAARRFFGCSEGTRLA